MLRCGACLEKAHIRVTYNDADGQPFYFCSVGFCLTRFLHGLIDGLDKMPMPSGRVVNVKIESMTCVDVLT